MQLIEQAAGPRSLRAALHASLQRQDADYAEFLKLKRKKDSRSIALGAELARRDRGLLAVLEHLKLTKGSLESAALETEQRSAAATAPSAASTLSSSAGPRVPDFVGYGAIFNSPTRLPEFDEEIAPGAFDRTLKAQSRIVSRYNHDVSLLLGSTTAKTLQLRTDSKGVFVRITPPPNSVGELVAESIRRGDVTGQSFAFTTIKDEWSMRSGRPYRKLLDVDCAEIGPVTMPAYGTTSIALATNQRSEPLSSSHRTSKPDRLYWQKKRIELIERESGIKR